MEFLFQRNRTQLRHMQRPGGRCKDSIYGFQGRSRMKHILGGTLQAGVQEYKSCKDKYWNHKKVLQEVIVIIYYFNTNKLIFSWYELLRYLSTHSVGFSGSRSGTSRSSFARSPTFSVTTQSFARAVSSKPVRAARMRCMDMTFSNRIQKGIRWRDLIYYSMSYEDGNINRKMEGCCS